MACGFCVRVLLLSLLALGQHAKELSYRSGSSNYVKPHFELAEDFPRSYKPSASSSYGNPVQPGGSTNSYRPSDRASSEYRKPTAAPSAGSYASYGRRVAGYSPEGSVSSYKPGLLIHRKPRKNPQQPPHQTNTNANGVSQTKAGMWDFALPQNGDSFDSGIASSYGIEIPSYPSKPQPASRPSYPSKPQPQPASRPSYPSKPQPQPASRPSYPSKPQPQPASRPSYPSKPQPQPASRPSYPSKPQPQPASRPSYPSKPQPQPASRPSYPSKPQPQPASRPSYPSKPQPQPPAKPQSNPSMWDFALPQNGNGFESGIASSYGLEVLSYPAKPQPESNPTQPLSYPAQPQPPSYLAKPHLLAKLQPGSHLAQPQPGVTQSKAGMWDFAPRSSRPIPMMSMNHPRWRQKLVPVYNGLHRP